MPKQQRGPIAVVGIGCRFPGADGPEEFWGLLREGRDAITEVPEDRWLLSSYHSGDRDVPGKIYTKYGGFVRSMDRFDPHFFGIAPREAAVMDPQQRMLLEVSWEAFEDAGWVVDHLAGSRTGVFIGISSHDYNDILSQPSERAPKNAYIALGTTASIAANRLSYAFDLRGPSLSVDTACSSSLVALHLACRSLWSGESDRALVGGVNAILRPETTINFCYASMLSPDGRCRAFDAKANGYVRAEGAGVVLLKPLDTAIRDRDPIYAVVLGTAVNQDGHSDSIAVPNGRAQEQLLAEAYREAGIDPSAIEYLEAHGTGTSVGDPIEANAAGAVLGPGRTDGRECWMGSVKTNIGHLEPASGVAGLIKTVLAIRHGQIPPSIHFTEPNPAIDLDRLRLRIPTRLEEWPGQGGRLAAINSFGFGGTNAHAVLAAPPARALQGTPGAAGWILPLSARSEEALLSQAKAWADWIEGSEASLADIAHTASVRRAQHPHRLAVLGDDRAELGRRLRAIASGEAPEAAIGHRPFGGAPRLAFVFTGMGPQWWKMGSELLDREPAFRAAVEEVDGLFRAISGWSILGELLAEESASRIQEAAVAQPAIFAIQAGLTALWRSWGVTPEAVVGHSVGEAAAALAAGALGLRDAVAVIYHRSRLQDRTRGTGTMLAVGLPADELAPLLREFEGQAAIAAFNGPRSVTLSGTDAAIDAIADRLGATDAFVRKLKVDVPYHGPGMAPLRGELIDSLAHLDPRRPGLPLASTVTGALVEDASLDASYWWRNVREPVAFAGAVSTLLASGIELFLEIGPHPVLGAFVSEVAAEHGKTATPLASLRRGEPERLGLLGTLGRLYVSGRPVDWSGLYPSGEVVPLPRYPWQREYHWRESEEARQVRLGLVSATGGGVIGPRSHALLGSRLETAHGDRIWHSTLDLGQEHRWLGDHRVQGTVVFPAAAYVEMAAATLSAEPSRCRRIDEIEFHKPLFLSPSGRRDLQLISDEGQGAFEIHGREADGTWTLHASGVCRATGERAEPVGLAAIQERCHEHIASSDWYRDFEAAGLEYGPDFRGVEEVWRGEGEALGRIRVPGDLRGQILHPGVLDSCFQVIRGAIGGRGGLYLPQRIEGVSVFRPVDPAVSESLWCHARLVHAARGEIRADLSICERSGQPVAIVRGLTCLAMAGSDSDAPALDDLLFGYRWTESESIEARSEVAGRWLVFAEEEGPGESIGEELRSRGAEVVVVTAGESSERPSPGRVAVRPGVREDLDRLLEGFPDASGVVFAWGAGPSDEREISYRIGRTTSSALSLVQALAELREPPRLWLVTRGSQSASGTSPDVALAPLWGLGRVVTSEHPALVCRRVDLSTEPGCEEIRSLLDEIGLDGPEDEIALRGRRRFVHRFRALTAADLHQGTPRPHRLELGTPGLVDTLALRSASRRSPGPGQVEIEVRAAGLNFKDVAKVLGLLSPRTLEGTWSGRELGLECSGVVTALGEGVSGFAVGDDVVALTPGCFGSHAIAEAGFTTAMPGTSFLDAAGLPVAYMTAHHALRKLAGIRRDERVLIHAAAGGVGLAAVRIALLAGAEVFATAGSPAKREYLRALGVPHVFDSRSLSFAEEILDATGGQGIDVVLNSLTGAAIPRSVGLLRTGGRFIEIGKRDIERNARLGLRPFQRHIAFFAVDLDRLWLTRPELTASIFAEVIGLVRDGHLPPLPVERFPASSAAEAFRHMMKARHTGKVVLDFQDPAIVVGPSAVSTIAFRPDATYLITGGLGGFGLATARWLVERGARHLALLGRSGATSAEAIETLEWFGRASVDVAVIRADVASVSGLAEALDLVRRTMPPIRGVFHAATVFDDGVIRHQTPARFEKVLGPKAIGAWNLHAATLDDPLDHFVLYSSVAALIGNRGQSNYVAANMFLDSLAEYRRGLGRPALSVNWTAIEDAGYVSRNATVRDHLHRLGLKPLPSDLLLHALGELLQAGVDRAAVAHLDPARWAAADATARLPRFGEVVDRCFGQSDDDASTTPTERIKGGTREERLAVIRGILTTCAAAVLELTPERIEVDRPLTSFGLDSLMAVELNVRLRRELGVEIPTMAFLRGETLANLALDIASTFEPSASPAEDQAGRPSPAPGRDWDREIRLDPSIVPRPDTDGVAVQPRIALLTGATGFLGAFLLRDLIETTDLTLACIVRARSNSEGHLRIRQALERYQLWKDEYADRFEAVAGDIASPGLGLAPRAWQRLAHEVDVIYHNGARLNLFQPYEALRPDNVAGTETLLRLACEARRKPFHYVSSLGVFDFPDPANPLSFDERDAPFDIGRLRFGYTQSKAVAECLVHEAGRRGLETTIYRPGLVNACSESGVYTIDDFPAKLIKSWLNLGVAPEPDRDLLLTPVNFVSRAIVGLSLDPGSAGRTYHLVNPARTPMASLQEMIRDCGYPLASLPFADWREQVAAHAARTRDEALAAVLSFSGAGIEGLPLWPQPNIAFDASETAGALADLGLECPPIDGNVVRICIEYFGSVGFVQVPV